MAESGGDLVAAADELYGLAPEEFTAARNARAKAAQAGGDRELAAAIRGLAKPTAAAWLANRLVRSDPAALEPLLELGTALRAASARLDGPEMRTLSRQQPKVVAALVRSATALASGDGRAVSASTANDLEDTLRAAVADADAAEQLMSGRLANSLQHNGFGLVQPGNLSLVTQRDEVAESGEAVEATEPGPDTEPVRARARATGRPAGPTATEVRAARRAEQLAAAERDLADAEAAVEVTEAGQQAAAERLAGTQDQLDEARAELERLREELERAKFAVSRAEGEVRSAKQSVEQAERAARAARHGRDDAQGRVDRLRP